MQAWLLEPRDAWPRRVRTVGGIGNGLPSSIWYRHSGNPPNDRATPKARLEYDRLIAEWSSNGRRLPTVQEAGHTVKDLMAVYWEWAREPGAQCIEDAIRNSSAIEHETVRVGQHRALERRVTIGCRPVRDRCDLFLTDPDIAGRLAVLREDELAAPREPRARLFEGFKYQKNPRF